MPSLTLSRQAMRRRIADKRGDLVFGTLAGTHSTVQFQLAAVDQLANAGYLQGAEVTVIHSASGDTADPQSGRVSAHTVASGVATIVVGATTGNTWADLENGDIAEFHRIGGRGFTFSQYNNAINAAIQSMVDHEWTDLDSVTFAVERGLGGSAISGFLRDEYPVPSGTSFVNGVSVQAASPAARHGTGNLTAFRNSGAAAASIRLAQGFQVDQLTQVQYVAFYMGTTGSPTDNWTCVIQDITAGVDNGTTIGSSTAVAGSTVQSRPRLVVFTFSPPLLLSASTAYIAEVRRAGDTADAANYMRLGEDGNAGYGDGTAYSYSSATGLWTALTTDLIFVVNPVSRWVSLAPANWKVVPSGTDQLRLLWLPVEGTPVRLLGGTAIAEVTTETASVPIAPDYCEKYAEAWLEEGRVGQALQDDPSRSFTASLQEMGLIPKRRRNLPANARFIYT